MLGSYQLTAQQTDYFQQEVDYRIQVQLNDQEHTLQGQVEIDYTNHSPDELSFIWFHLWPNAYRDQTTAFAQQQRQSGSTAFYFAKDSQLGYMDSLQFSVDDTPCRLEYHPEHPDMVKVWLPQPLAPGAQVQITTPFFVKIPASFSRLGHVGESYQITQWYPKPAVYDREGWHPMPYLDRGEFYSEFGDFEVEITLPANYVVGATGSLQTESEMNFLKQKVAETKNYLEHLPSAINSGFVVEPFPASDAHYKTIRYTAEKVHDFAWFADKRFKVLAEQLPLPDNREITAWSFFTKTEEQLWRKSLDYLRRSVVFYSELVGPYPYPQVTAVQSALSAGGGMEYPMITVIDLAGSDRSLDEVITHEVGHNWFYGILASNERDHPWMDEGVNSFYEQRYMHTYYPPSSSQIVPTWLADGNQVDVSELAYQQQARQHLDQAPDTPSGELSEINYWLSAYDKPAQGLWWLYSWLGPEKFDGAMQAYYQQWQYRHPQPADFQRSLEQHTGHKLNWFFSGVIAGTQQVDYAVQRLQHTANGHHLTIENKGELAGPVKIQTSKAGEPVQELWLEGFTGRKKIALNEDNFDLLTIDPDHHTLDLDRKNNQIKTQGLFKKWAPFRVALPAKVENPMYSSLYLLPMPGWNAYDGWQAGVLIHNRSLPFKKLEFDLLPLYGFKSGSLNGIGNVDYHFFPKNGLLRAVDIGLNYRQFHFNRESEGIYDLRYRRWQPSLDLHLRTSKTIFRHQLGYRLIHLETEAANIGREDGFMGLRSNFSTIHEWHYAGQNRRKLNPFEYRLTLEQQGYDDTFGRSQQYLKWSAEWKSKLAYAEDKQVSIRVFAGGFFKNTRKDGGAIFPGAFSLLDQATMDYRYDDFYFGRSEREGFWSQQVVERDGGFKVPINPAFNIGRSNNFIAAVNLKADLPFGNGWPVRPYLDLGYFDNAMPTGADDTFSDQFLWSGGLALEILDGRLGFYFPLANSKNIQDRLLEQGSYAKRIAFKVDLYGKKIREMWPY